MRFAYFGLIVRQQRFAGQWSSKSFQESCARTKARATSESYKAADLAVGFLVDLAWDL